MPKQRKPKKRTHQRSSSGVGFQPGAVVLGYTVERPIVRDHDGLKLSTAYRAHAADGTPVVLKAFDPDPRLRPEQVAWTRQAFGFERRALLALDHPAIPTLLAADFARPRPLLVMQAMEGRDLHAIGVVPRRVALAVGRSLAEAVAHIHERGWAHLDLKADHLLVTDDGAVALIDLGSARPLTPFGQEKDCRELAQLTLSLAMFPLIGLHRGLAPAWHGDLTGLARQALQWASPAMVQQFEADPVVHVTRAALRGGLDAAGLAAELADLERAEAA